MKTVRKANKVLNIEDSQLNNYMLEGYDELDINTGKVIRVSPNKAYSVSEFEQLKATYEKKVSELEKKLAKKPTE